MFDMKTSKDRNDHDSNENILEERLNKLKIEFENDILEDRVVCQSLSPTTRPNRLQGESAEHFESNSDDSRSLFLCLKLENDRLRSSLLEMDGKCRRLKLDEDRHAEDLELYKQRNEKLLDLCVRQHDKLMTLENQEAKDRVRDELHNSIDEQFLPGLKQATREIEYFRECCEVAYNNLKAKRNCNINANINELCTQHMKFLEDQIILYNKRISDFKQLQADYSSSAFKGFSLSIPDIIETIKVCLSTFLNQYITVLVTLLKEKDSNNNLSSINNILEGNMQSAKKWEANNCATASQLDPTRPPFVPIFNPTSLPIPFFTQLYKFPQQQDGMAQSPMNRPPNMMPQVVPSWIPIRTNMYSRQQVQFFSPTIRRPPQPSPQPKFQFNDTSAFFQQPRNPQPPPMCPTFQQSAPPVPLPPPMCSTFQQSAAPVPLPPSICSTFHQSAPPVPLPAPSMCPTFQKPAPSVPSSMCSTFQQPVPQVPLAPPMCSTFQAAPSVPLPPPMCSNYQQPALPSRLTKSVHDRILKAKQTPSQNKSAPNFTKDIDVNKPNDALKNKAVPDKASEDTSLPKKAPTNINPDKDDTIIITNKTPINAVNSMGNNNKANNMGNNKKGAINKSSEKPVLKLGDTTKQDVPGVFEFKAQINEGSLKTPKLDEATPAIGDVFSAFGNQIFWPNFNEKAETENELTPLTNLIDLPMPIISKNPSPLAPVNLFMSGNKQDYLEGGKYHLLYNSVKDQINYSADVVIDCLEKVRIENGGKMSFLTHANILEKVRKMITLYASSICMICRVNIPTCHAADLWCGHVFHKKCITEWLKTKVECPICRTHINLDNITAAQW